MLRVWVIEKGEIEGTKRVRGFSIGVWFKVRRKVNKSVNREENLV